MAANSSLDTDSRILKRARLLLDLQIAVAETENLAVLREG